MDSSPDADHPIDVVDASCLQSKTRHRAVAVLHFGRARGTGPSGTLRPGDGPEPQDPLRWAGVERVAPVREDTRRI
jgi:hypothetical protein